MKTDVRSCFDFEFANTVKAKEFSARIPGYAYQKNKNQLKKPETQV